MICLDTNAVIAVLNDRASPVRARIDAEIGLGRTFALSSIVLFELRYGAAKSAQPDRNARRIAEFLSGPIEVLPFDPADADEASSPVPETAYRDLREIERALARPPEPAPSEK